MPVITAYNPTAGLTSLVGHLFAAGSGITASNIQLQASASQAVNLFSGFGSPQGQGGLGISDGLLLTTGWAPGLTNSVGWDGASNGAAGDADVDAVVNTVFNTLSYDATSLSFDFSVSDPAATSISFDLVFGSEEYPEWVDLFVDSAIVLVNGVNVALFNHDPLAPLSVVSSNLAAGYFQANDAIGGNPCPFPIEYDGVSQMLKIVAPIHSGTNTIKIAIADTGDHILDSGLFIANMSAGSTPGSGVVVTPPTGGTSGNDVCTGSSKSELFELLAGNDLAFAAAGDDIVVAGSGLDTVYGGAGDDVLDGGGDDDWLDGGIGLDTAIYKGASGGYQLTVVDAAAGVFQLQAPVATAEGLDQLVGVETLQFSDGLFSLDASVPGGLKPVGSVQPPAPANSPGVLVISGLILVGHTLTVSLSDPDGLAAGTAPAFTWQRNDGTGWQTIASGSSSSSYTLAAADVDSQLQVLASYTDGKGQAASLTSAPLLVPAVAAGDLKITLLHTTAPAGWTIRTPLTTLVQRAIELGLSANEAIARIRSVLGLPAVNLASYDAYGVLQLQGNDAAAIVMEKVAVQAAILTSLSDDDQGLKLTQAILNTAPGSGLDLASASDLALILNLDTSTFDLTKKSTYPDPLREIVDRNQSMAAAITDALESGSTNLLPLIQKEWNDFASIQDNFSPADQSIASLSVAINGAPVGAPTAQLQPIPAGGTLIVSSSELLAGFTDPNAGDLLSVEGLQADQPGLLQLLEVSNGISTWAFTPDPGVLGPVELSYSVSDGSVAVPAALIFGVLAAVDHPASGTLQLAGTAAEGGSLIASFSDLQDADGAIAALNWQWQIADGATWLDLAGETADTLLIADDQSLVDQQVRVVATSTDAQGGQTLFAGEACTISNVDDGATGSLSVSGVAQEGQTLSASLADLSDVDGAATLSWRWQEWLNGSWSDLAGSEASALVIPTAAGWAGRQVRVLATSTDARGGTTLFAGDGAVILPAPDLTPPTLTAISLQGLVLTLRFSEAIASTGLPPKTAFTVQTVGSTGTVTSRTIAALAVDSGDPSGRQLILTLSGTAPASSLDVRVSYSDAAGNQATGVVQDPAGNDLAAFSNRYATTFRSASSVTSLASHYDTLQLTGTGAITGSGNAGANTLIGNSGANTLTGAAGADTLTGGGGNDSFRLTALNQSLLAGFDRLTDYAIGVDRIDGPTAVAATALKDGVGTAVALTTSGLQAVLTATTFLKNGASTFGFSDPQLGTRTFLALNDATAGFQAANDAIVEITGYSGALTSLAVI